MTTMTGRVTGVRSTLRAIEALEIGSAFPIYPALALVMVSGSRWPSGCIARGREHGFHARALAAWRGRLTVAKRKDLAARGARVVSVFGPFNSRVLVDMPADVAVELFDGPLADNARTDVIDAALRGVEALRKRDADLADSALAAGLVALAFEIAHPFNSATSKAALHREMRESLDRLAELAPPATVNDRVDDLAKARERRHAS